MRRMPAEWEAQEGILLCFPHNGRDWPGKYGAVQWAFVEFIRKVAQYEKVFLVVADPAHRKRVTGFLERAHVPMEQISFVEQKTNRSWMRDSGPIVVRNGEDREALAFAFNGWAKYGNHRLDKLVPDAVARHLDIPLTRVTYRGKPVVLEGGAIDVNGQGSLLTSEECLLHPEIQVRNPGYTRVDYETIFREFLGVTHVIWLGDGILGDDTHGHIDDLARFVSGDTIVAVVEEREDRPNFRALRENWERLQEARLENGRRPRVLPLPMPDEILFEGLSLPASYANFLILNHAVLVPTFNDANDRKALEVLQGCFPDRKVIGISSTDFIWGFGTLHCLSQQIPSA